MAPCCMFGEDPEDEGEEFEEEEIWATGGIKVFWRNGLKPEGTADIVGQCWKPLEPDLALLV